jgi:hypothetical protein
VRVFVFVCVRVFVFVCVRVCVCVPAVVNFISSLSRLQLLYSYSANCFNSCSSLYFCPAKTVDDRSKISAAIDADSKPATSAIQSAPASVLQAPADIAPGFLFTLFLFLLFLFIYDFYSRIYLK